MNSYSYYEIMASYYADKVDYLERFTNCPELYFAEAQKQKAICINLLMKWLLELKIEYVNRSQANGNNGILFKHV